MAATAVDNALRDSEVRAHIEHLRRLRRGLLDAADEERHQLELELRSGPLRELDDLDRLLHDLAFEPSAELRQELAVARDELVQIAHGLYPEALLDQGVIGALQGAAGRSPVPVTFDARFDDRSLPLEVATTAYYVANEALANVAKHARARNARLELATGPGELLVPIIDDGVGGADPAGAGLSGMRERLRATDGELDVQSPPSGGTVIEARMPLPLS